MKIEAQHITILFIAFVTLKFLVQMFLSFRNVNHIKANRSAVPAKFADKISLEAS